LGFDEVGRGCEKYDRHSNRELGFFAIAVEKVFSFRADWQQDDRAKPLVRQYQIALDSILTSHSHLQRCVTHCVACGIRFFTHPRNAGRRDLRCPFGCRQHHRRQRSNERSTAYYHTPSGRWLKKRLNAHRSLGVTVTDHPAPPDAQEPATSPSTPPAAEAEPRLALQLEGVVLRGATLGRSPMLPYVRMLVQLIERVVLSYQQLLHLLRRALRQHSIGARRRTDYVLHFLHQHPP
jgi:hypothetical protein